MVDFSLSQVGVFRRKDKAHRYEGAEPAVDGPEEDDLDASEFEDEEEVPKKIKNRRPKEDRFTQQRLDSWNFVITPKTVLPIYLLIAVIFVIVGGCVLAIMSRVNEITIYYHDCSTLAPSSGDTWGDMPTDSFFYAFQKNKTVPTPQWRYVDDPNDDSEEKGTCQIRFEVPQQLPKPVYVNYLIEKFKPNHRRYVLSFSEDQLRGYPAPYDVVHDNTGINCKPLSRNEEGKIYYPCGLIANSMFNDTFPMSLTNVDDTSKNYSLTNKGINWHTDGQRFKNTRYNHSDIAPPPYWIKSFPNGYNETNIPNIHEWEEFQNWMRPAAFDRFAKLIRKNSNESLPIGTYQIDIGLHWPVKDYNGKKALYITHGSRIGGKNPFLGIVYLIGGCICAALALLIFVFWMLAGRKVADESNLSWNR